MTGSDDRTDAVALAVGTLTLLAVVARVAGLGARSFHWDEARVGYWTLRYLESGAFSYRPVAGGPLLYHLDRHVFALFGATDHTARMVVALIGGLLPLAALLFRRRLRPSETVAMAVILAFQPLLLYYSRFLRGDVPLAAFGLVVVGCAIRYRDGGERRFLYGGAAALALAVASSAFVGGYLASWLLAGVAVFDHRRFLAGTVTDGGSPTRGGTNGARTAEAPRTASRASGRVRVWRRWISREAGTLARAAGVFAAVYLWAFAPRAGAQGGPGLWTVSTFPTVVRETFVGSVEKFLGVWVVSRGTGSEGHALLPSLAHHAEVLLATALPLVLLAAGAFVADRYGGGPSRPVVAFAAYWAGAALFVFPAITEGRAPWVVVHVAIALALPAAVALGWLGRVGARGYRTDRSGLVVAVVLVLLAVGAQAGAVGATAYEAPERSDRLVDYAQPASDLDPLVTDVAGATAGHDGVDVVYFGDRLVVPGADPPSPPVAEEWGHRLPLPWYVARLGAETDGVRSLAELERTDAPVVIADASQRAVLASRLGDGYRARTYDLALWDRTVVVFVER